MFTLLPNVVLDTEANFISGSASVKSAEVEEICGLDKLVIFM